MLNQMLMLGVHGVIEINAFLLSVKAGIDASLSGDTQCE